MAHGDAMHLSIPAAHQPCAHRGGGVPRSVSRTHSTRPPVVDGGAGGGMGRHDRAGKPDGHPKRNEKGDDPTH
jgi:hypothetical protein